VRGAERQMDQQGTPHRQVQKPPTYIVRVTAYCHRSRGLGNGSSGMGGSRPLTGQILDFAIDSSKSDVRTGKGGGDEGSCGKVVSRGDEEGNYRPGTLLTLTKSNAVFIVTGRSRAFFDDIFCVAYAYVQLSPTGMDRKK